MHFFTTELSGQYDNNCHQFRNPNLNSTAVTAAISVSSHCVSPGESTANIPTVLSSAPLPIRYSSPLGRQRMGAY